MTTSSYGDLLDTINGGVTYHDGYTFSAIDWTGRQAGSILVRVGFLVDDYAEFNAPNYAFDETGERKPKFGNRTHFAISPDHHATDLEFWREFFEQVQLIDSHEAREAFRVWVADESDAGGRWVGPFNPHNPDGQLAFHRGDIAGVRSDLTFGDINLHPDVLDDEFEEASFRARVRKGAPPVSSEPADR